MPESNDFGRYLEKVIKDRYDTQKELADLSGVSTATISRILDGSQPATPRTIKKLAPFLGVSVNELMKEAGLIDDEKNILEKINNRLYHSVARANELSDEDINEVAEALDMLINQKMRRKANRQDDNLDKRD